MGVRVYALKNVGQQDVIAVLRDGRIYKATLP
jgi:small nuclear ribonucleoprotein (snRNP)-like protein